MISKKSKRQTQHILSVQAQYDKLKDEEWAIGVRERPWLDPEYHTNPENVDREMVIAPLIEERRAIEIKLAETYNELMKLMEDYGWTESK